MAISFYNATVPAYVQTLTGVAGFLDRGLSHCADNNMQPSELVEARIFADMAPLSFQVQQAIGHSIGALEALKVGVYSPGGSPALDYQGLQQAVADALERLKAIKEADLNAFEGKDMAFQFGEMKVPFVAETFIASFSMPNFYFHSTTAYDILRMKGVPLGKRDFMGPLRMKR